MKVYSHHRCARQHLSPRTFAKCAFPRAAWIAGQGRIAVVAWCGTPTLSLHESLASARESMAAIANTGCGHCCVGRHEMILLGTEP